MKRILRFLFVQHLFVGVGAMFGGTAAITNPINPLGIPSEMLKYSPFDNFTIPGIVLFVVIGLGNVLAAISIKRKWKFYSYTSNFFSWTLVFWIVIQCIMLRTIAFLHILFFAIGLVGAVLGAIVLLNQRLFPANIVMNILE